MDNETNDYPIRITIVLTLPESRVQQTNLFAQEIHSNPRGETRRRIETRRLAAVIEHTVSQSDSCEEHAIDCCTYLATLSYHWTAASDTDALME